MPRLTVSSRVSLTLLCSISSDVSARDHLLGSPPVWSCSWVLSWTGVHLHKHTLHLSRLSVRFIPPQCLSLSFSFFSVFISGLNQSTYCIAILPIWSALPIMLKYVSPVAEILTWGVSVDQWLGGRKRHEQKSLSLAVTQTYSII